jgi:hypothetical protein
MRKLVVTLLTVLASLGGSAKALAAEARSYGPSIAYDDEGAATVAWTRVEGSRQFIQAVRIRADGTAEPIRTLGPAGFSGPSVQVDSRGRPVVGWSNGLVRLEDDGSVTDLGSPLPAATFAIDGQDRVVVVAVMGGPPQNTVLEAVRVSPDGSSEPVQRLGSAAPGVLPVTGFDLAIDSQDRASVVWGGGEGVRMVRVGSDGAPGPVQDLEPRPGIAHPQIAFDSQDRAIVVWEGARDSRPPVRDPIRFARVGADGTVGPTHDLSLEPGYRPQVVVDSLDRATVAWSARQLEVARISAEGTPSPARTFPTGFTSGHQMAVDDAGRVTLAWHGSGQVIQSIRIDTDGTPGEIVTLAADRPMGGPQLAVTGTGQGAAVWTRQLGPTAPLGERGVVEGVAFDADRVVSPIIALSPPDRSPPDLALGSTVERRGTTNWFVTADCDEYCELTATGMVRVRFPSGRVRKLALQPVRSINYHGRAQTLYPAKLFLQAEERDPRFFARVLRHDAKVTARLAVTATDVRGNVDTGATKVRLSR